MATTRDAIEFARDHGGVITTHEAVSIGLGGRFLSRLVERGVFVRLARGVHALPGAATRSDVLLNGAVRHLGAVISHQSAARLHGMSPIADGPPTVSVSHRQTHSFPGVDVHQLTDLIEAHLVDMKGMPVTNPERTMIDLAAVLHPKRLQQVLDTALSKSLVDTRRLHDLHGALARRGKPGSAALRQLLTDRVGEPIVGQSELERRFIALLRDASLPEPIREFHAPWLRPSNGRVDFGYPDSKLIVEVDGRRWHSKYDAFEVDRRRDNAAQLAGWRVLRFTWRMVTDEPHHVISAVREALGAELE